MFIVLLRFSRFVLQQHCQKVCLKCCSMYAVLQYCSAALSDDTEGKVFHPNLGLVGTLETEMR